MKDIIVIHGALKKVHAASFDGNFRATAGNGLDFSSPAGNAVLLSYVGASQVILSLSCNSAQSENAQKRALVENFICRSHG